MSDRGYKALNIQIEAQAIQAEIDGIKAHNAAAPDETQYGYETFARYAEQLRALAQQAAKLVDER